MYTKICLLTSSLILISITVHSQRSNWVVPDFVTMQYAGSIGYFSAGVGYNVFKNKARFSTHYGIVPENRGGYLNVVSTKLFFKPTTLTIWNRVRMNPIDVGLMGSFHFGDEFETRWPEGVHPKGYYWWHPALRAHLAMESSVTYEFRKGHRLTSVTGYVEFNTNELYFVSFIQNIDTVSLWDIVKIGTGARLNF
jgi:hypothetical protein